VKLSRRRSIAGAGALGLSALVGCRRLPWQAAPARTARVGYLSFSAESESLQAPETLAFHQSLQDLGWVRGQNLSIEYRFANGRAEQLPTLAHELAGEHPDVIFTGSGPAGLKALSQATTAPIVTVFAGDPVEDGLVDSYARPGRNLTGVATFPQMSTKRLELLKEAVPSVHRIAVLTFGDRSEGDQARTAAAQIGLQAMLISVQTPADFAAALDRVQAEQVEALMTTSGPIFSARRTEPAEFAAKHRLPSIFYRREFVVAGGLMSYGPNFLEIFRRAGHYVDRILRGANAAELPIEQPMTFDLAVNMTTARAIGITFSSSFLLQVTEFVT
jgi:putative tryptophan/tyrosine transport system substrate-binding protein